MVTIKEAGIILTDSPMDLAERILDAKLKTSEIYAFQLKGLASELYNVLDSLEYVKPASCPNGQYQIVEESDGSLNLLADNYEKYPLCYDPKRVVKRYLRNLNVRVSEDIGRRSQIYNTDKMYNQKVDMYKWYVRPSYHFIPIIMHTIDQSSIKYYSEYLTEDYIKSYIESMNTKYEQAIIDNESNTAGDFDKTLDYTNIRDICRVAYFDDQPEKLESVMNQMKTMFNGLSSYKIGELVEAGALNNIPEFKSLRNIPPQFNPSVCLKDILMDTYNKINNMEGKDESNSQ